MEPAALTWVTAAPCPLARFEANGAVIDGELWVLGGFTASSLEVTRRIDIYDQDLDAWRGGPELPGAETHIAVVGLGDDLVIAGGFTGSFGAARAPTTDAVFRLHGATSQWVPGPPLPSPGAGYAWALLGTELHLAGGLRADGNTDSPDHLVWDTAGDGAWETLAPLANPRNHGGGATIGGRFYAIGGRHEWNEMAGNVADVDAFDPVGGAWTAQAPLPTGRSEIGGSTSTLADGRILVVGGSEDGKTPSADVLVFDPRTNAWTHLPSLPEPRKGAVAAQVGRRIVVTTGSPTTTDPSDTTFVGCCL